MRGFQLRRHARDARHQRRRVLADLRLQQLDLVEPGERRRARENLVEHDGERIEIAALVALAAAALLGRHIERRADRRAGARHAHAALHAGDAEVHDLHAPVIADHQIGRLNVAMDHAHLMRIGDAVGGLRDNGEALLDAERSAALAQHIVERAAAHQLHHHIELIAIGQERVERGDVRMIQTREALRLRLEAPDEFGILRQLGAQRFDRDLALDESVEGDMHLAHRRRSRAARRSGNGRSFSGRS